MDTFYNKQNREKILKAQGVVGFLEKSVLQDKKQFIEHVEEFVIQAEKQKNENVWNDVLNPLAFSHLFNF